MSILNTWCEPIPWEYQPLEPVVTDWVALLDTDPAEAFRVRYRLELQLKGPPASLNLNEIQAKLNEDWERLRDIRSELSALEEEKYEVKERIEKMEHIITQSRRRGR